MVVLAAAEAAHALLLLGRQRVDPSDAVLSGLPIVGGVLLTAVGLRMAWDLGRDIRRRHRLADLVSELEAGASGSLASILANSLGDPTVEVAYWIPSLQRHVDALGRTVIPMSGPDRTVATLERFGVELGEVTHASSPGVAGLENEVGSAARLAVDNERLRAELLAQANEIRESQARIVAAGDAARRRLERDLHDGAQQSLLALSYKLRMAVAAARGAGADSWALALSEANGYALTTIDDVRRLAHGIFPSILVDAGLVRALEALREESNVRLDIDLSDPACGEAAAMAVYQLVGAVIDDPGIDGDSRIAITSREVDDRLMVHVVVDAPVTASPLAHAIDRIGAVGGTVSFTETRMRVGVPCG
jgi:signal transduction histidine kinase